MPSNPQTDFGPAIARFRELAADSGDRLLLGDGPPNPDARLLDLCAEALHHLRSAEKAYASRTWPRSCGHERSPQEEREARREDEQLMHLYNDGIARAKPPLVLIAKEKAATAAGVYAKALLVRASKTGAASLAMSLAEDLVNSPALRAAIWPVMENEAAT